MRKYWISGFMNKSRKIYDDLEMAVRTCEKYNKRAKYKRYVMSGIPEDSNLQYFTDVRQET